MSEPTQPPTGPEAPDIPHEDELEAAEAHLQALLDEQRRQLLDDVTPDPAAYIAVTS